MKTLAESTGFHHNGRTVFALEYELEPPAGFNVGIPDRLADT